MCIGRMDLFLFDARINIMELTCACDVTAYTPIVSVITKLCLRIHTNP